MPISEESRRLQKLTKLKYDLRVAEEEVNSTITKDNYEIYLESMLANATEKHEKELAKLKEEYERKVLNAVNAFDRTKIHCETQLKGIQERKQNTPRIRKLRAEIKIIESEYHERQLLSVPTPPQPEQGVVSDDPPPPPTPVKRDSKGKRIPKTVSSADPIVQSTFPTDIKSFATGLQNGNMEYTREFAFFVSNASAFKEKYGYTMDQVFEYQAKLFPPDLTDE